MRRTTRIASFIALLGAILGTTSVAVAAPTTSTDVQTLEAAESHLATLLRAYSNTPNWKAHYKAALAAQSADIARVNADLFSPAKGHTLTCTTTGTVQTPPFLVRGTFSLSWNITAPQGGLCDLASTDCSFYPEGSNPNNWNLRSGDFDELGCQKSSAQVSGISGSQFLYVDTTGHVVVTITGPVIP